MVTIKLGNKKRSFKSIRLAAEAAGIDYYTFYMRLYNGNTIREAFNKPVRKYAKKIAA